MKLFLLFEHHQMTVSGYTIYLRPKGIANSMHVRLFDCLRVISGNQVLERQELPCNN